MLGARWTAAAAFSSLILGHLAGAATPARSDSARAPSTAANPLSVMTYNVAGLPFPAALDRTASLQEIGRRLGVLRQRGAQPHILLLQEAFTPEAKAIAAQAGYRYVAHGPSAADMSDGAPVMPAAYRAAANWRKGETEGKWVDSGLVVMSDFPIVRVARMAFAADACAGYDCLAAKGVLLTWIKVPGLAKPVAVADTHLNSRHATGVANARADAAFTEQLHEARQFLADHISSRTSVVFGGDFNIGHAPERIAQINHAQPIPDLASEVTAQVQSAKPGAVIDADLRAVIERAKDKQFFHPGTGKMLRLTAVEVPFGISRGGCKLSDHLGYVASYAVE